MAGVLGYSNLIMLKIVSSGDQKLTAAIFALGPVKNEIVGEQIYTFHFIADQSVTHRLNFMKIHILI